MTRLADLLLALAGVAIVAYGAAMLLDYRGWAGRYWASVLRWHRRRSNVWRFGRPAHAIARHPRFNRYFGAGAVILIGATWILVGLTRALAAP